MSPSAHDPPPALPAHVVAAGLALLAALAAQTGWPAVMGVTDSRQQIVAGLTLATSTAFLAATGWLHVWLLREPSGSAHLRRLIWNIPADAALALVMIAVFLKAPNLNVWQSGLWLLPPLILTASGVSAVVLTLAALRQWRTESTHAVAELRQFHTPLRSWVCLVLLGIILLLG